MTVEQQYQKVRETMEKEMSVEDANRILNEKDEREEAEIRAHQVKETAKLERIQHETKANTEKRQKNHEATLSKGEEILELLNDLSADEAGLLGIGSVRHTLATKVEILRRNLAS